MFLSKNYQKGAKHVFLWFMNFRLRATFEEFSVDQIQHLICHQKARRFIVHANHFQLDQTDSANHKF